MYAVRICVRLDNSGPGAENKKGHPASECLRDGRVVIQKEGRNVLLIKIYYETSNELLETRMGALYKKVQRTKFV